MNRRDICWAIVRLHSATVPIRAPIIEEDIMTFHNQERAREQYIAMLEASNNGFSKENLKLVTRPLNFGEGVY